MRNENRAKGENKYKTNRNEIKQKLIERAVKWFGCGENNDVIMATNNN